LTAGGRRYVIFAKKVDDIFGRRGVEVSNETIRRWVVKFGRFHTRRLRASARYAQGLQAERSGRERTPAGPARRGKTATLQITRIRRYHHRQERLSSLV
jgi:hypothetical protein